MAKQEIILGPGDELTISVPPSQKVEITPAPEEPLSLGLLRDFTREYAPQIVHYTQAKSFEDEIDLFSEESMERLTDIMKRLRQDNVTVKTLKKQVEATLKHSFTTSLSEEDLKDAARNFSTLLIDYSQYNLP